MRSGALPLLSPPSSSSSSYSSAPKFSLKSQPWLAAKPISSLPFSTCPSAIRRRREIRARNGFNFASAEDDDEDGDFGRKRRRRRWWSDKPPPSSGDRGSGALEEFLDCFWIFKVFQSYGWWLPAIILSMLLATGPKAFLMALALPIGQSIAALAVRKLLGGTQDNAKRKPKTQARSRFSATSASNLELEEEDEEESQGTEKRLMGYQSWVARDDVSVDKDGQNASTFGGWDKLDGLNEFDKTTFRRSVPASRSGRMRMEKGKFSKRDRKGDAPLLLRLLVAVFPFLGSWTKML
ncbi:uncharacterized protein LOC127811962 [Diospyros lotus]|uniref:uncharacterized protein LOC127811962 n=1 Tax=Diospyros lotus TaxID=55363 RepID=UPI00225A7395|nr:uncharacterized protein LOC127811962 [Diospyros lotus]